MKPLQFFLKIKQGHCIDTVVRFFEGIYHTMKKKVLIMSIYADDILEFYMKLCFSTIA